MLRKRLRFVGLTVMTLGLALMLTVSGMAQQTTPTPTLPLEPTPPVESEEQAETPTPAGEEATPEPAEETPEAAETPTPETAEPVVTPTEEVVAVEAPETPEAAATGKREPQLVVAGESEEVELTVYSGDLGLVKEIRTLALSEGENLVRYSHVPSSINPASVHFSSLSDPEGTVVLEQDYEYDLVNTRKLLQKYVDRQIALTTEQGTVYTGTLLSGVDDAILATGDGIKVIRLSHIQEFFFPELPEGLITKPTLVWLLVASAEGEQRVRVTYLTGGINWQADYIGLLAPDDESLSMTGWVTLDNKSGATYKEARLKLVAGDIHRAPEVGRMVSMAERVVELPVPAPAVEERAFFEYHVYEVQRPVTVRDRQTKQIEFVAAPSVEVEKVFVYEASPPFSPRYGGEIVEPDYGVRSDAKVQVRLEFVNEEDRGLGLPLPQGTVRVYKEDVGGGAEFVGEDRIDHTAKDEEISLYLGNAFDIVGERVQTRFRQLAERVIEESYEITLRNHKTEDVSVRIIEHLFRAQDAEIVASSADYEMLDATTIQYEVEVSADGEAKIEYTVRYTW